MATVATPENELELLAPPPTIADRVQKQLHARPALGPFIVLIVSAIVFSFLTSGSIGAAMILAQLFMAKLASSNHWAGLLALLAGLVIALATGALNGGLVTRFRIPPFIATLGTLSIFSSIGLLYSNGQTTQASQMPHIINWTGDSLTIGSFNLING